MSINSFIAVMLLLMFSSTVEAKEWRGLIPLKSAKEDVEGVLGKPNQFGHYQTENEKVNVWYSDGPCDSPHGSQRVNCECLVAKGTVLRIAVTLEVPVKVSQLGIDKTKLERTPIHAATPTSTYADFVEGVVYTVLDLDDKVTFIDYLPSSRDCDQLLKAQADVRSKGWHGIVPLRSTRAEVDSLIVPSKSALGQIYTYDTPHNRVDISYAPDPCKTSTVNSTPNAADVVLDTSVTPKKPLFVSNLALDKNKYIRIQFDHPENWVQYLNSEEGITVEALLNDGREEVIRTIYRPPEKERQLRCGTQNKPK